MTSLSEVLNQEITAVHIRWWDSTWCNAEFAYELTDGRTFMMPDFYTNPLQCQPFDNDVQFQRFTPTNCNDDANILRLIGVRIVDILVPLDRELRNPESFCAALSSGDYLFEETSQPHGTPPPMLFVTDAIPAQDEASELISVFELA